jgi:hypothetical protein
MMIFQGGDDRRGYRVKYGRKEFDSSLTARDAMAGLGTDDQKSAVHATTPIATAFKTCMSHRKKWALESPAGESWFFDI